MNVEEFLKRELNRRQFLGRSAQNAAGMAAGMVGLSGAVAKAGPKERLQVGVIGVRNRGRTLAEKLAAMPDVDVAVLCDVDERLLPRAIRSVQQAQGFVPRCETDFRRVLDERGVDAVVIATPDHWHALMTILACQAGKHVYLEKPVTHSIGEVPAVLDVVRRANRVVQTGLQQRSGGHFQAAVQTVRSGEIGTVRLAKAWTVHRRTPTLPAAETSPPQGVHYDLWLGPAPARSFHPNRFHYHWRWFWDYGTGELGNWGVHMLDVARWGLGVELPQRIVATGGNYGLAGEHETPDALLVQYDYGEKTIVWEHRQWSDHGIEGRSAAVAFYGDRGTLIVDRGGWKIYDAREPRTADTSDQLRTHLRDFVDCVKSGKTPAADIQTAAVSTVLCHLGNIAYRLRREVRFDAQRLTFPSDPEAAALLQRAYRHPWELPSPQACSRRVTSCRS